MSRCMPDERSKNNPANSGWEVDTVSIFVGVKDIVSRSSESTRK